MEKCIYKGEVLYAYQVLQNFDFEQEIRSCHALTCCDCGEPVFFKHGKQRAECFAHYKREACKYGEYCSKQSNIFKHTQHELYAPLKRIAGNRGFALEEDVIIIHDHYTAFVLRSESVKYAIDIIDTVATSATLEKRKRLYEDTGYQYLQITVDKDAESEPFSEREMAYFPVKYSLNKSLNHTAIVIDKERKKWFIYILDNMDKSNLPDCFYDLADWYEYDAFAAPISLDDLDICTQGFFTTSTSKAYSEFCSYRRAQKAHWIKEEVDRRERRRKQAEEAHRRAEIRCQEYERCIKENEEKRRHEVEARQAVDEEARQQTSLVAEHKRQQQIADGKAEMDRIHRTTGAYVGSKIKGKYERFSLEELTSSKPGNWLREYTKADFEQKIAELKEYKASAVKTLFAKLYYINSSENAILIQFLAELEETDPESARVIRYLMNRAGIN
ncbi:MAG: hypothetical protein NC177_15195 [Ruminococcus flavefaciens]|nr:hypothetical protein [Ruminococcus flavefaciens]